MNSKEILFKVVDKENLTKNEAYDFLSLVMKGDFSEILLSSFLTAMKFKGEVSDELFGFARAMRDAAIKPKRKFDFDFLDTCGTGGDGKNSINISTLAALTLASMGVKVAKHGNRSVSSVCGSSDLLIELGYKMDKTHEEVEENFLRFGFVFLFAPFWHPAMKFAANVRKELGFRTFFNLIGPLCNPFSAPYQIVGVYSKEYLEIISKVLIQLELKKSIVCHSEDGFDEFSVFHPTLYYHSNGNDLSKEIFHPSVLKLKNLKEEEIFTDSREKSVKMVKEILLGKINTGSYAVALNAGVSLYLMEIVKSIPEGFERALSEIECGKINEYFSRILNG
ncbi:MAG: anthranilate phosphoribosyltransferase [Leptospiraceae bacterium]|nr:anthranilate phosphoribosyltransferase [Leptospiraceae bacterium]MCK6379769.1 anthranilate phosphoribosyltransferase [Leptospiraceae bacterium]NUM41229.1 anthranilate phosphoribosyltransferase [Leptospiraceae bacterium]